MTSLRPVQVFGLEVPPGEEPVPAIPPGEFPATFRVTMAAIDPTVSKDEYAQVNGSPAFTGATLRIIRVPEDEDDDDDEDDEDFDMAQFLDGGSDEDDSEDDEEDSDDEEVNGGPSDPAKSPKAKREAAREKFREALAADGHDMEVDDEEDSAVKLTAKQKGKAKALDLEDMDDDEDDELELGQGVDEMVLCTLDLSRNYQQPLDITINEHETVYFQASGTHSVYLTGNILIPEDPTDGMYDSDDDSDEEDYDLPPDEDELDLPGDEDESDELDDLDDPRITEVDSEDEEEEVPPKLVKAGKTKQGTKKRPHDESEDEAVDGKASLDEIISKSLKPAAAGAEAQVNGDQKLSKSQAKKLRKKLKDNAGNAVDASSSAGKEDFGIVEPKSEPSPASSAKSDKKVQFAKTLVQGPSSESGKAAEAKAKVNGDAKAPVKTGLGPRVVQGVTVDDKKLGSGPAAKKGDKVSMRYIGKLDKDKKVFDSNKKGKPFMFTLGASQVIKGWDIGVAGMTVGGERRITIPAPLAYGSKGAGKDIPPNSTLVFDVKLLNIA